MSYFMPEQPKEAAKVPWFDDVTPGGGWQGRAKSKSSDTLRAEITACIGRLGGLASGFQRGSFNIDGQTRDGYQIHYAIENKTGKMLPGRLDIAALPVKPRQQRRNSVYEQRREQSLKMALYMIRVALDGMWFLQQLPPGYAPLMPWMLAVGKRTVTQLWAVSSGMGNLLPPGETEFIEGEIVSEKKR